MTTSAIPDPAVRRASDHSDCYLCLFGQYTKQWDLALPALVLGIMPVIIFFLAMQKYIIEGITQGAVKG